MVIRNGWFSYRWTEIFEMGHIPAASPGHTVLMAQPVAVSQDDYPGVTQRTHFAPYPVDQVVAKIVEERPAVIFAPHVETSTGMILPDHYIKQVADAIHAVGGIFVLDCIASGTVWVDMKHLGVDVLISAPQKGWTGPPCAALVMMSERAVAVMREKQETSFSMSLKVFFMPWLLSRLMYP
jgi:alanine-glyoxylate transaminase / serine-glyoxylate transaminase / serine-pyruvate transaminase